MNARAIKIRLMQADDFDAAVGIDARVLKESRSEYYKLKFEKLFQFVSANQFSPSKTINLERSL